MANSLQEQWNTTSSEAYLSIYLNLYINLYIFLLN